MEVILSKAKKYDKLYATPRKSDIPLEDILLDAKEFADKTHEHIHNNVRRMLIYINEQINKRLETANNARMDLSSLVISQEDIEISIDNGVLYDELSKVVAMLANKGYNCGLVEDKEHFTGNYNIYIYLMSTYEKYYGSNTNRRTSDGME